MVLPVSMSPGSCWTDGPPPTLQGLTTMRSSRRRLQPPPPLPAPLLCWAGACLSSRIGCSSPKNHPPHPPVHSHHIHRSRPREILPLPGIPHFPLPCHPFLECVPPVGGVGAGTVVGGGLSEGARFISRPHPQSPSIGLCHAGVASLLSHSKWDIYVMTVYFSDTSFFPPLGGGESKCRSQKMTRLARKQQKTARHIPESGLCRMDGFNSSFCYCCEDKVSCALVKASTSLSHLLPSHIPGASGVGTQCSQIRKETLLPSAPQALSMLLWSVTPMRPNVREMLHA